MAHDLLANDSQLVGQTRSTPDTSPWATLARRLIDLITVGNRGWGILLTGSTLLAAWLLAWSTGQDTAVSRHWFYVPVVLAAVRLGPVWTLAVAAAAGLLAGPLVPLPDVGIGLSGHGQWLVRTGFFAAIGVLIAVLTDSIRRYQQQQINLATQARQMTVRERDLAVQRASVIQTVSHELRTPLTIIKGTVATWAKLKDDITPAEAAKLIPPMQRATQRLESLVATVLAAADAQGDDELTPVPVDTSELLARATRRVTNPDVRARVETTSYGDATITTVPDYIVTALGLLLDNALKFSPEDQPVTLTGRSSRGELEIEVRDHGPGIDQADVERLFEPFTQADQSNTRVHSGLGIGLYTCRKLIRALGGDIDLERHPDGGAIARVTVPVAT